MKTLYMGRNIGQDDKGYYITFSDRDEKRNKHIERAHFATWAKAKSQMDYMLTQGHTWFDAHTDMTI